MKPSKRMLVICAAAVCAILCFGMAAWAEQSSGMKDKIGDDGILIAKDPEGLPGDAGSEDPQATDPAETPDADPTIPAPDPDVAGMEDIDPAAEAAGHDASGAAGADGSTQGGDADGNEDGGADANGASGADGNAATEPEEPQGPFAVLTPVDNESNIVNLHQLPDSSFLYDTSLTDLAEADSRYDNQTVQITGEVVGDLIKAGLDGSHVWVTLASTDSNSDATVEVYMTTAQASIIDTLGRYGATGTILQVRGTFHLTCPDHQGTSDIHVENVNVVSPGTTNPDVFNWADFRPGIIAVLLGGLLLLVFHFLRQRLR